MGDISKDINSTFPNNKVKALLNIIYTANWISSKQIDRLINIVGYNMVIREVKQAYFLDLRDLQLP